MDTSGSQDPKAIAGDKTSDIQISEACGKEMTVEEYHSSDLRGHIVGWKQSCPLREIGCVCRCEPACSWGTIVSNLLRWRAAGFLSISQTERPFGDSSSHVTAFG